jgi:Flp pilus assembly protein TadD
LSHSYLRNVRFSPTREQDLVEAEAAAERAMTLDPRSSFSHLAMGCVRYERRRMNEARAAFEYSIALNPNEPHAHASLGAANIMLARPEEALQPLRRAMTLSPRDPTFGVWQMFMGVALSTSALTLKRWNG